MEVTFPLAKRTVLHDVPHGKLPSLPRKLRSFESHCFLNPHHSYGLAPSL